MSFKKSVIFIPNARKPAHVGHFYNALIAYAIYNWARDFVTLESRGTTATELFGEKARKVKWDIEFHLVFDVLSEERYHKNYLDMLNWMGIEPDGVVDLKSDNFLPWLQMIGCPKVFQSGFPALNKLAYFDIANAKWNSRALDLNISYDMQFEKEIASRLGLSYPYSVYHTILIDKNIKRIGGQPEQVGFMDMQSLIDAGTEWTTVAQGLADILGIWKPVDGQGIYPDGNICNNTGHYHELFRENFADEEWKRNQALSRFLHPILDNVPTAARCGTDVVPDNWKEIVMRR